VEGRDVKEVNFQEACGAIKVMARSECRYHKMLEKRDCEKDSVVEKIA
jgi:hypothetical protein